MSEFYLYLYLTRAEWADTWINGGEVPISLASSYRSVERRGIHTPDENLIHEAPMDLRQLRSLGFNFGQVKGLTFFNNYVNGRPMPNFTNGNLYLDDGLILSLSTRLSEEICKRLGKSACVQILDVNGLKNCIDTQLGVVGTAAACQYTSDHQRNHFLKSKEDEWQQEFRIFWASKEPRTVVLPPGLACLAQPQI